MNKTKRKRLLNLDKRSQLKTAFGQRLQQLRSEKHLSSFEFESRSGIDPANLKKYEKGTREPGLIIISIMAKALDVHPWELLELPQDTRTTEAHGLVPFGNEPLAEPETNLAGDPICILRALMAERGLRQRDLTKILGVSRSSVSNILNYRSGLSKKNIRVLAGYFKIDQAKLNRRYDLVK